jgi:hypothetical protein
VHYTCLTHLGSSKAAEHMLALSPLQLLSFQHQTKRNAARTPATHPLAVTRATWCLLAHDAACLGHGGTPHPHLKRFIMLRGPMQTSGPST